MRRPDTRCPGHSSHARRFLLVLVLALTLTACPSQPHGFLVVDNRSPEPIYVYFERFGGDESLRAGPILPGQDELIFVLPRGRKCPDAGAFVLRDKDGKLLARRDNTVDPVCDGDPWIWTGDTDRIDP